MANIDSEKDKFRYLLQELQLDDEENEKLNQYLAEEKYELAALWLRKKRIAMLTKLHESQKAIDDLDLLVHQIRKMKG